MNGAENINLNPFGIRKGIIEILMDDEIINLLKQDLNKIDDKNKDRLARLIKQLEYYKVHYYNR